MPASRWMPVKARASVLVGGQAVAVGADPAGEDESEADRAVLEIV